MAAIKISSKVEEATWNELKALAEESHQNISGLLTEAIADYVRRRRVRPTKRSSSWVSTRPWRSMSGCWQRSAERQGSGTWVCSKVLCFGREPATTGIWPK